MNPLPEAGEVVGAKPPLVPPGTYDLLFIFHETIVLAGGRAPKLVLWFCLTSPGPFMGKKLPRYYNVLAPGRT
jgi:hypothetical protein